MEWKFGLQWKKANNWQQKNKRENIRVIRVIRVEK